MRFPRQRMAMLVVCGIAALLIGACGGSPHAPGPVTPPGDGGSTPPGPNTPPVIESIELSAERLEVDAEATVTAHVKDVDTPVDRLKYEWKADAGTFSGEGQTVRWRAPADAKTPADYVITLTVTETYGLPDASGNRPQNVVTSMSAPIRVHNSPKEVGDLAMGFLNDFVNSSVSASTCVREFSDSCGAGKGDEKGDIEWNRDHFRIVGSALRLTNVRIGSSGQNADANVACTFTSVITKCEPEEIAKGCVVGSKGTVEGNCALTAIYEQKRWWLCTSNFDNGRSIPAMFKSLWR